MPTEHAIFTIGYAGNTSAMLLDTLVLHGITVLADIRSVPYSKANPGFDRDAIRNATKARGLRYLFMGDQLGARPSDRRLYSAGRVNFDRVIVSSEFQAGLARLASGRREHRIALMCAEKEPLTCHRALLVGEQLQAQGIPVEHITGRGRVESHAQAMLRLPGLVGSSLRDLFSSQEEQVKNALQAQLLAIASHA
jgi:uncharacterized protein (DUF488 family)